MKKEKFPDKSNSTVVFFFMELDWARCLHFRMEGWDGVTACFCISAIIYDPWSSTVSPVIYL